MSVLLYTSSMVRYTLEEEEECQVLSRSKNFLMATLKMLRNRTFPLMIVGQRQCCQLDYNLFKPFPNLHAVLLWPYSHRYTGLALNLPLEKSSSVLWLLTYLKALVTCFKPSTHQTVAI